MISIDSCNGSLVDAKVIHQTINQEAVFSLTRPQI